MKKYILFLCGIILFTSCEKLLFDKDQASTDPYVNFDYLWNQIDQKYSYFEFKNLDWNQVKDTYRAQLSPDMTEEQLFDLLGDMMNQLQDDHANLISPFNVSRYNLPLQHESNYSEHVVSKYYIPNYKSTGSFHHDFIDQGNIGYIRYESFSSSVSPELMNYLTNYYKNTQGLIFDLRANGGGSVSNIFVILEAFCSERKLVAYSINRDGPNHNDFGEREPIYLLKGENVYNKPVMVLIDRYSFSASTFFSVITKALDHVVLVGDTTGGGGGLPNGGVLPNGWRYRFSVSQLLDLQGHNYAEAGVPPDIHAAFNWNDMTKDEIIDAAVAEIHKRAQKK
ncbi:MAG TPA: S41 family peptidase [Bacteroidales bacterium]|nr:S41 family peptidase [Bacteroidales bacterium]